MHSRVVKSRWFLSVVSSAAVVALGLTACANSNGGGGGGKTSNGMTSVTIATPGASSAFGFLWVAQDEGIFAKNGLKVSLKEVSNAAQVPGMASGSFQAIPQAGTTERAALQGQSVINVLSALTSSTSGMVVRKGINSAADLRGTTIATASASSTPNQQLQAYLAKNGLTGSVKVLPLQTISAQTTAFTSGQADGLFLGFDSVVAAGGHLPGSKILVTPTQLAAAPGAQAGLGVSKSFLSAHPDTVKALIRSILEATKFTLTQPDKTQAVYAKDFGLTSDEAAYVYKEILPLVVLRGSPTDQELATNAALDSKSVGKTITVDDVKKVWDTTLATQAFSELKCPDVCAAK
jgi:NitT/TauT family transport system substrate-binding protein